MQMAELRLRAAFLQHHVQAGPQEGYVLCLCGCGYVGVCRHCVPRLQQPYLRPGVLRLGGSCTQDGVIAVSNRKEVVLLMDGDLDGLIATINSALEAGDWSQVVMLTAPLNEAACAVGEGDLAELVQDLHWIANDALVHPLEVARMLQP